MPKVSSRTGKVLMLSRTSGKGLVSVLSWTYEQMSCLCLLVQGLGLEPIPTEQDGIADLDELEHLLRPAIACHPDSLQPSLGYESYKPSSAYTKIYIIVS
jgi:hypothetical protein